MQTIRFSGPTDEDTGVEEVFYIHYRSDMDGEVIISKTLENEEGSPVNIDGELISIGVSRYDDMKIPMVVLLDFVGQIYVANRIADIVADTTGKELIDILIGA